jgi:hypothetical protein
MAFALLFVIAALLVVLYYQSWQLHRLSRAMDRLVWAEHRKEHRIMDNLDALMEAVTAQTTLVGSVVEFINGLEASAVSPEAKQAILDAIHTNSAALEAAIAANVPPVEPPVEPV